MTALQTRRDSHARSGSNLVRVPCYFDGNDADNDAGDDVADGEAGELLVRSPAVCAGYWNDPTATTEALTDGWFRTGDLVSRDADGYYWFRGRRKEIIIRGGSNISPQEVEEALYRHPEILEAGVVGMPHAVGANKWWHSWLAAPIVGGMITSTIHVLILVPVFS